MQKIKAFMPFDLHVTKKQQPVWWSNNTLKIGCLPYSFLAIEFLILSSFSSLAQRTIQLKFLDKERNMAYGESFLGKWSDVDNVANIVKETYMF